MSSKARPKVVILGAGFGGLTAARKLGKHADVTLVDRHNFQTFLPLLYQVATAGLAADHVAHPIRGAIRNSGIDFRMGSPIFIDYKKKTLILDNGEKFSFDHLIVALGSTTADFGIKGVSKHALGMKTAKEAINIRAEIMRRFETLCKPKSDARLSIAVVGGGPTGVEMAGAIAELVAGPLTNDQPHAASRVDVSLIEAGGFLLPSFSNSLSNRAKKDLEKLGVKVRLNTAVAEVTPDEIKIKDAKAMPADMTIWAAGVKGETNKAISDLPATRSRIDVEPTLQVVGLPHVWAIGDISGAVGENGRPLPMVAPVAMQQGRWVAKQIARLAAGLPAENFKYKDKGSMATIGRHKAVVEVNRLHMAGIPAWYAWLWLHLFYLLGGRNKIGTMADWTWNYITFDRGNRHIMDAL